MSHALQRSQSLDARVLPRGIANAKPADDRAFAQPRVCPLRLLVDPIELSSGQRYGQAQPPAIEALLAESDGKLEWDVDCDGYLPDEANK